MMIKKRYLLKANKSVIIPGDRTNFLVSNVGGQINMEVDFGTIPISDLQGTARSVGTPVVLATTLTVDGANSILERLGAYGKIVEDLATLRRNISRSGKFFSEEHCWYINLTHHNGKLDGAVPCKSDGTYIAFGTDFFTEEAAKRICASIKDALEMADDNYGG